MSQSNLTTEHKKGQHLTFFQRAVIQTRLKDGKSAYAIAKEIGCSSNTVRNEIKRGMPELYWGKEKHYDAVSAQSVYEGHRLNSHRKPMDSANSRFLKYVYLHFTQEHWSLDACVGYALKSREFSRSEIVCTKTLYNYVERGLLSIKNIDLPEKLRRKTGNKHGHSRDHKRLYGKSIEERPASIQTRKEFGHWELDLVIGSKSGQDHVLMTILERKTRYYRIIRLSDKTAASVMKAFKSLRKEYGDKFSRIFKTITTDNGSEFSSLPEIEQVTGTCVYYAHPYSSYEKGSNERHNGILRRYIPKGKRIDGFSCEEIEDAERRCNTLPRKILNYFTPRELFRKEMLMLNTPS